MQQRKKQKGENNLEECSGEDAKSKAKHRTAVHPRRVDEGALRHLCFPIKSDLEQNIAEIPGKRRGGGRSGRGGRGSR